MNHKSIPAALSAVAMMLAATTLMAKAQTVPQNLWIEAEDLALAPAATAATRANVLEARQPQSARPQFLWNVGAQWFDQLPKPANERVEAPFLIDPPLLKGFTETYAGKKPPVYDNALSGAVVHIPYYPAAFADGSPTLAWLDRNPDKKFAILLNYGQPDWPAGTTVADKQQRYANLKKYGDRFLGFIAGENIAYAYPDLKVLEAKVRTAQSRTDVLAAMREVHTAATVAKFSDYFGEQLTPEQAWAPVVSCLSRGIESHALAAWGEKRVGHESTGNSAALSRRLAFLRGAARQFGTGMLDYQSINFGDSATIFARESYFYPASSRYVLDSNYDVWGGAGSNWLLKDYVLWNTAGVDAFYNEQGTDFYWKPGGGAAGDDFPIQLSPKGKIADAMQRVANAHPRGAQHTPVAFLLDPAHGWDEEEYQPGAFGRDPVWNPKILAKNRHDAAIRGWMDVAYYPAPETENEPATSVRQTYVNGKFGDIFDAIVSAPDKTEIAAAYPVLVALGEINLTPQWGNALKSYVQNGGTLVVSADQFSGVGAAALGLQFGKESEAFNFVWKSDNSPVASNVFRYKALDVAGGKVLAATPTGAPLCVEKTVGKGRVISIAASLGVGINEKSVPLLALVMKYVTDGVMPIRVEGDVEWALNKLDGDGWLVTILNNRGINKPQHGVTPTDYTQRQTVTIHKAGAVKTRREWMTETEVRRNGNATQITVPAGAVRMVEIR